MTFDKVISLGPSCETAWQIRQIVHQPEAYVFDWVIASASSVARALRTDFSEIVQPAQLTLQRLDGAADHPFILDAATGIEYHHDFRNDADFLDSLPDVQQKYGYLIDRMRRLLSSDARILFVHKCGSPAEARSLEMAVEQRFPKLRFKLLELSVGTGERTFRQDGRLIFAGLEGKGSTWEDRAPEWAEVFDVLLVDSFDKTMTRAPTQLHGVA